jgi:hypothetical protein
MADASDCLSLFPKGKVSLAGESGIATFRIQITMLFSICTAVALRCGAETMERKARILLTFVPCFSFPGKIEDRRVVTLGLRVVLLYVLEV